MNEYQPRPDERGLRGPGQTALVDPRSGGMVPFRPVAPTSDNAIAEIDPHEIWRVLTKWRWLIVGCAALASLLGLGFSLLSTPMYRSSAQVEIALQTEDITGADERTSRQSPVRDPQYLATQIGLLKSRSLAERVIADLGLGGKSEKGRPAVQPAAILANLAVVPVPSSRLINITYSSSSPQLAADVSNAIADGFIASNLERQYGATSYARTFLENRIAKVKAQLEVSERQLVEYAQKAGIIVVNQNKGDDGGDTTSSSLDSASLVALNEALAAAQSDRISAEQKYRNALRTGPQSQVVQSQAVQSLTAQKAALDADYQDKLNLYKPDFPEMVQLRARIQSLSRQIATTSSSISGAAAGDLRTEYLAAAGRENELRSKVSGLKTSVMDLRGRSIQYTILQREVDTNRQLYDGLLQRYKEVGVAGGVSQSLVSIIDRAKVPGRPYAPSIPSNLAFALFLGLMLGVGIAFGIEFIDDTVKNPDDIKEKLKLSLLGVVPTAPKGDAVAELLNDPTSEQSEAYSSARNSIDFATSGGVAKSILITSCAPGEGKSVSSLALAQKFARSGRSVLLIDADMRKPTFKVKLDEKCGLSSLLASHDSIRNHIARTSIDELYVVPSGPIPPNPAELLAGRRMRETAHRGRGHRRYRDHRLAADPGPRRFAAARLDV